MIVDSSALLAILRDEPEAERFLRLILQTAGRRTSAANLLEASIVIDSGRDPTASRRLDEFLERLGMTVEPVPAEHSRIGREAYRDYGKGSGHPAQLTFGDCFAYALAKQTGEPLLFKGADFGFTDVRPAT